MAQDREYGGGVDFDQTPREAGVATSPIA